MNRPKPELPTREEVEQFVKESIVEADDSGTECVDDREKAGQSMGRVRAFGGDLSYILASAKVITDLEIDVDNADIVDAAVEAKKEVKGEDARLNLHDDEEHKKKGGIGCGHAAKASDPENEFQEEYGLSTNNVKELVELAFGREETHIETLVGGHNAKGVLLVYGDRESGEAKFSVHSRGVEDGLQFFVVDIDRTRKYFEEIIPMMFRKLGLGDIDGVVDKVWDSYETQKEASTKVLAKGLPVYNIIIDSSGEATVERV